MLDLIFSDRLSGSLCKKRRDKKVVHELSLAFGLDLPADHQRKLLGAYRFLGRTGIPGNDRIVQRTSAG